MSFDLNKTIRDALDRWQEPDPHVIARRLLSRIPEEEVRAALGDCLADRVRIVIGRSRMQVAEAERSGATPGPSRWSAASRVLQDRFYIGGVWKMLGDCDADDLDLLADDYAKRAAEQAALEHKFRLIAARLRSTGAATVRDLGEHDLVVAA